MLKACRGPGMRERRDEAILRLMFTTGMRAGEVVALTTTDVDLRSVPPVAIVRRGKGGQGRVVPLAIEVAASIDRYQRSRKEHRLSGDPALWLGDRGKRFSYDALHQALGVRARAAGVTGFHPHRLRHTAANRWLSKGGSEGGLMAVASWTRPDMLLRYTKAQASARAAEEALRLTWGTCRDERGSGPGHPARSWWKFGGVAGRPKFACSTWPVRGIPGLSRSSR